MPGTFSPLLRLGDHSAFSQYWEQFESLYRSHPVRDYRGCLVRFGADRCEHVCYTGPGDERYRHLPEYWSQERAERIPWIGTTLQHPEKVHYSHTHDFRGHLAYLLSERREEQTERGVHVEWVRYMVVVKPLKNNEVRFITAFPPDKRYWDEAQTTEQVYPRTKLRSR